MPPNTIEYEFTTNQDTNYEDMDELLTFFSGDEVMNSIRTKIAIEQFNETINNSANWKEELSTAQSTAEIASKNGEAYLFPWSDKEKAHHVMKKARGLEGRINNMRNFLTTLVEGTFTVDPKAAETCQFLEDSVTSLSEISKTISTSLNGIFEAKRVEEITPEKEKEIREPYVNLLNDMLEEVGVLRNYLQEAKGSDPNMLASDQVVNDLSDVGLVDGEGKWNPDKIGARFGTMIPPEILITLSETEGRVLDTDMSIKEYNGLTTEGILEKGNNVVEVKRIPEETDELLSQLATQVANAKKIVDFVTGTPSTRKPGEAGVIQRLLNQRMALAQAISRLETSINSKYEEMATNVRKTFEQMKNYELEEGMGKLNIAGVTVPAMIEKLTNAEVIQPTPAGLGIPNEFEWAWSKGDLFQKRVRTGSPVKPEYAEDPFSKSPMEGVELKTEPEKIYEFTTEAVNAISDAYWQSIKMQHAIAGIAKHKITTMRQRIVEFFDEIIIPGMRKQVNVVNFKSIEIQKVLQRAGDTMFPISWVDAKVENKFGTKTWVLSERTEKLPPKEKILDMTFKKIDEHTSHRVKDVPVENLLEGIIIDAIEPVMTSFVGMFKQLNETNKLIYELTTEMAGTGTSEIKTKYRAIEERLDPDKVSRIIGTDKTLSNISNLMEGKFIAERTVEEITNQAQSFDVSSTTDFVRTIYTSIQEDLLNTFEVLLACSTEGRLSIIKKEIVEEEPEQVREGIAFGEKSMSAIIRELGELAISTVFVNDRYTTSLRFDNTKRLIDGLLDQNYPQNIESETTHPFNLTWNKIYQNKELETLPDNVGLDFVSKQWVDGNLDFGEIINVDDISVAYTNLKKLLEHVIETQTVERQRAIEQMSTLYDSLVGCEKERKDMREAETEALKKRNDIQQSNEELNRELESKKAIIEIGNKEFQLFTQNVLTVVETVENSELFSKERLGVLKDSLNAFGGVLGQLSGWQIGQGDNQDRFNRILNQILAISGSISERAPTIYDQSVRQKVETIINKIEAMVNTLKVKIIKPTSKELSTFKEKTLPLVKIPDDYEKALERINTVINLQFEASNNKIDECERDITKLGNTINSKESEIDRLKSNLEIVTNQKKDLENQKKELNNQIKELQQQLEAKEVEMAEPVDTEELEFQIAELEAQIKQKEQEIQTLEGSIEEFTEQLEKSVSRDAFEIVADGFNDIFDTINRRLVDMENPITGRQMLRNKINIIEYRGFENPNTWIISNAPKGSTRYSWNMASTLINQFSDTVVLNVFGEYKQMIESCETVARGLQTTLQNTITTTIESQKNAQKYTGIFTQLRPPGSKLDLKTWFEQTSDLRANLPNAIREISEKLTSQITDLTNQMTDLTNRQQTLSKQLESITQEKSELEREFEQERMKVSFTEEERRKLEMLEKEKESLETRINRVLAQLESANDKREKLSKKNDELQTRLDTARMALSNCETERTKELATLEAALEQQRTIVAILQEERENLLKQIEEKGKEPAESIPERITELESEIQKHRDAYITIRNIIDRVWYFPRTEGDVIVFNNPLPDELKERDIEKYQLYKRMNDMSNALLYSSQHTQEERTLSAKYSEFLNYIIENSEMDLENKGETIKDIAGSFPYGLSLSHIRSDNENEQILGIITGVVAIASLLPALTNQVQALSTQVLELTAEVTPRPKKRTRVTPVSMKIQQINLIEAKFLSNGFLDTEDYVNRILKQNAKIEEIDHETEPESSFYINATHLIESQEESGRNQQLEDDAISEWSVWLS